MSKFFIGFLNAAQLVALHDAGHTIETGLVSAGDHALAIIKANPIGALISADIATLKDSSLSGVEKAAKVVASAIPLIESLATGGVVTLVASVEDTARLVVQSLYNDTIGAVLKAATAAAPAPSA
uniref:hypothetical protein n=1 Tax=uncultured Sphingomonas sp. TaxID=158754 RepID=UPI0035CA3244